MKPLEAYQKDIQAYYRMSQLAYYSGPMLGSGPVVSLATYKPRLGYVKWAVLSICAGTVKPSRLIVMVPESDRGACIKALGDDIISGGVEVVGAKPDFGPHNKWYMPCYLTPYSSCLVTADDDHLYPVDWLAELCAEHSRTSDVVIANRVRVISTKKYSDWQLAETDIPSFLNLAVGCSGVLYPSKVVNAMCSSSQEFAVECPRQDDIWLKYLSLGVCLVRQAKKKPALYLEVPGSRVCALFTSNFEDGNDRAIQDVFKGTKLQDQVNTHRFVSV